MAENKTRIALLLGGDCSEREISWKTGRSMYGALAADKYEVTVFDVISNSSVEQSELGVEASRLSPDEMSALEEWWSDLRSAGKAQRVSWQDLAPVLRDRKTDVVLPALHGGWGEDGTLQSLLEVAGTRYAGSPARSSVLAMDKRLCKAVARDLGIPTARSWLCTNTDAAGAPPLQGRCVIKPNSGGSSVGVTILENTLDEELWRTAVAAAIADGGTAIIEEFIAGVEVTAAVIGTGGSAHTLPLIQVVPENAFFDFESKYAAGGAEHLIPPRLGEEVQNLITDYALRIHRTLGCRGVARSDWIITSDNIPYFLEINTLPGMTRTSLVPDAARAAGIAFEKLVEMLIEEALQ